jgi:3D (Asp-Asp-Asp) domain-containing protein
MRQAIALTGILLLLTSSTVPARPKTRFAGYYTVTAYCACARCCGKHADGITATGKPVRKGMVAADWRRLPPGTRLRLSCLPERDFVVEDKGGAIKGRRIDVYMPTHRKALAFGIRRKVKLWIVDD